MTERQKLTLQINSPTEISLLYDEPIVGTSHYGKYALYAVESAGMEYSFFAPDSVHEQIKTLSKGESAIITKLAAMRNNKVVTAFDVVMPKPVAVANENSSVVKPYVELDNESHGEINDCKGSNAGDKSYDIMLNSLRDAAAITKELDGLVDVNRIGITLFIARSKSNNYGG